MKPFQFGRAETLKSLGNFENKKGVNIMNNKTTCFKCDLPIICNCNRCAREDNNNIKNKCFCDYCNDFVYTSECETIETNNSFEVACNKCYIELYKKES